MHDAMSDADFAQECAQLADRLEKHQRRDTDPDTEWVNWIVDADLCREIAVRLRFIASRTTVEGIADSFTDAEMVALFMASSPAAARRWIAERIVAYLRGEP